MPSAVAWYRQKVKPGVRDGEEAQDASPFEPYLEVRVGERDVH